MKIAVDARTMGSMPSGIGMYTFYFLEELIKHSEIEFSLISDVDTSEQMQELKKKNVPVYLYGKRVFRSAEVFHYFDFVNETLQKLQPDFFWEPNNLFPKALKSFQGKLILTIHDMTPVTTPQYFGFVYRMYFRIMLHRSVRMTDIILYDSETSQKEVEKYEAAAKGKMHFLSYAIIKTHERKERTNASEPYFFYVGNIEHRKGSELLIKAYQTYRREGGTYALYLGGAVKDKDIDELLKQAMEQDEKLHYFGYLTDRQKSDYLSGCEAFLFPSRAEGFGIPIMEAMEYEKPIIAGRLPIFTELVGDCIQYFDINDDEDKALTEFVLRLHECEKEGISVDAGAYRQTLERYDKTVLGDRLVAFLAGL